MSNHSSTRSTLGSEPSHLARARHAVSALGVWLFLSAFLWPHSPAQHTNTWVVGALMLLVALVGSITPAARFYNTVLASWLFISNLVMGGADATLLNNLAVAVAVFSLSLIPRSTPRRAAPPFPGEVVLGLDAVQPVVMLPPSSRAADGPRIAS